MPTFKDSTSLQAYLESQRTKNTSLGFIPTMGALHNGHLSLVKQAIRENTVVVISIFVNPTQFGDPGDLKNYPRTLSKDEALLYALQEDLVIFSPSANELYNGNVKSNSYNFGSIASEMEGRYRQGHFDGVGTVLELLFDVIKPTRAYFGQKDFQQLQIVKKLVQITKQPIQIIGCEIYREPSGLAMSSRNKRLTNSQLEDASFIYKTLSQVQKDFDIKSAKQLTDWVTQEFKNHKTLSLEYFEIANIKTLKTIRRKRKGNKYRAFIAAFIGEIRLIDNVSLNY